LTSPEFAYALFSHDKQLLDVRIAADEQWRLPTSQKLPLKYIKAVLSFEDKYFKY
jgi:membrane carboxypeptidase/penicillin-binding protein PbpC